MRKVQSSHASSNHAMFHKVFLIKLSLSFIIIQIKLYSVLLHWNVLRISMTLMPYLLACYFEQCLCIRIIWYYKNNKVAMPSCKRKKGTSGYLVFITKPTDCNLYIHFSTFQSKGKEDGCSKGKGSEYKDKHEINYLIGAVFLL